MKFIDGRLAFEWIRFPDEDIKRELAQWRGENIAYFDDRIPYQDELSVLVLEEDFEGALLLVKERERRDEIAYGKWNSEESSASEAVEEKATA